MSNGIEFSIEGFRKSVEELFVFIPYLEGTNKRFFLSFFADTITVQGASLKKNAPDTVFFCGAFSPQSRRFFSFSADICADGNF